ncbi:MAG: SUMF1/EgtB/PvdO family nonheme iron enzyme [Verrucomicrobiota bacterium]
MEQDDSQPGAENPETPSNRQRNRILKAGESLGNYRVVRCICASLYANYYQMQHVRDLHEVTVVIFHPMTREDPEFLDRLQSFLDASKKFKYERFPKITEYAEINDRHCLFLEPVQGMSLTNYLNENAEPGKSGIGPDRTTRILAQLHGALGYAHTAGYDHRDLSSDHIFISEKGNIQILGLGFKSVLGIELFERIVSASVLPFAKKEAIAHVTSLDALSPEYRLGMAEDMRADIYAVGMIGYWLLTGMKPEPANLTPASKLVEMLPKNWDRFFKYSMMKDREERYRSCKVALLGLKEADPETGSERAHFVQRHIDRIPVPKGIRQRGESATSVYRITVISLVGIALLALTAAISGTILSLGGGSEMATKAKDLDDADLILRVKPARSLVTIEGTNLSFLIRDGQLPLNISPGEHQFKITAPEHDPKVHTVRVLKEELTRSAVELNPAWAVIEVQTEPEAAIFFVDEAGVEIQIGTSDEEGRYALRKVSGQNTYAIRIKKAGFQPYDIADEEFSVGEEVAIEASMELLPSIISVQTEPSGAAVYVDNLRIGQSPIAEFGVVPEEMHTVQVELDGFRGATREIQMEVGEAQLIDFGELIPRSGALAFDLKFIGREELDLVELSEEVRVVMERELFRTDAAELEQILEGWHEIEFEHPYYLADPVRVRISDRETEEVSVEFRPKPAYVELEVPSGLSPTVLINGRVGRVIDGRVQVPSYQVLQVEIRIRDHLNLRRSLELEPGRTLKWVVTPSRIPPPVLEKDWKVPYIGLACQWLDPGSYTMGSPLKEHGRIPNEGPQTLINLNRGFWIAAYETTQQQYEWIMEANPSSTRGPKKPVDSVTWAEAKEFCQRLTEKERRAGRLPKGYVYRLPTEAEWEYAARAGSEGAFFFGEQADVSNGNFQGVYPRDWEEGRPSSDFYGTREVGSYAPNAFGLYDMHGNLSEWTLDKYNGRLKGGEATDPLPYPSGKEVTLRGGSWENNAKLVRSASRDRVSPQTQSNSIGFRVVLAPGL